MTNNTKKVILIGDFSIHNNHFGCKLVSQTFREQFQRVGLELIARLPINFNPIQYYDKLLKSADLIIINGEGAIHNGRYQEIINLGSKYPCILVNCVYENNPKNDSLQHFKLITTRESLSANELISQNINAKVVPDVIYASAYLRSFIPRSNLKTKETGYTDSAKKSVIRIGPMTLKYRKGFSPKSNSLDNYLNFLCEHKKIAVGRFHSLICCSIFEIPFSTWESNTWKIRGLMNDIGLSELHFQSRKEAINNIPKEFSSKIKNFTTLAKSRVESLFDDIANML